MTLYKLFRTKRKLRRKDAQRTSTTDLDTSGILAQPFPPMVSRAKSPCDILDFVGYPRIQLQSQLTPPPLPSPMVYHQICSSLTADALPLTVRNKTPTSVTIKVTPNVTAKVTEQSSSAVIIHQPSSSTTTGSPRDLSEVQMPAPKKAMPPTWRILNADRTDKTLVESKQLNHDDAKKAIILHQQKVNIELEREDWARREEQHRQLEQQMIRRIQENQAKIDQLSCKEPNSCKFKSRHSHPDLRAPHQRFSPYMYSSDGCSEDEEECEENEDKNQHSTYHAERSSVNTDRYFLYDQAINRHNIYHHNRLLLTTPMKWVHSQPPHYSDNDDDGYASEDDDSSYFEDKPSENKTTRRQYNHSNKSSDEEEESSDDFCMNYWESSRSRPVYYANPWPHPQSGYHHLPVGRFPYQQHIPLLLNNSAVARYNYHQRTSSLHLSNERARKPLLRHYSYEDVPGNEFVPYSYR